MQIPLISVLLPVYNGRPHLEKALDSILSQSIKYIELIVIDDASTDETPLLLQAYSLRDSRIRIITNEYNLGVSASSNKGLRAARATMIARMDADDWSHPERLQRQYTFMQEHPRVTICGTFMQAMETRALWSAPTEDQELKCALLMATYLYQPTIMGHKEAFLQAGGYAENMSSAEDYDLWTRIALVPENRFAVIPEPLVHYRLNLTAPRTEYRKRQRQQADDVRRRYLQDCGFSFSEPEWNTHQVLCRSKRALSFAELAACPLWMEELMRQNDLLKRFPAPTLRRLLARQWLAACRWNAPALCGTSWLYARHPVQASFARRAFWSGRMALSALKHAIRRWTGKEHGRPEDA